MLTKFVDVIVRFVTDTAWILIIMTNIGKFLVSTSFGVIYPYTTELFPTVIRNSALGFMSTCGRFSSLIAPQLTLLVGYTCVITMTCLYAYRLEPQSTWWRHQMETFSASLAFCAGNSPVTGEFPHKGQWRGVLMFSLIYAWINSNLRWWFLNKSSPSCYFLNFFMIIEPHALQ